MKIAIVTDSSADLPADLIYKYNVRIVPTRLIIDGKIRYDNGVDIHSDSFYQDFRDRKKLNSISTEPPSVDEFLQIYKRLCLEYDSVLSIHVAGRLSDTLKNARQAVLKGTPIFKRLRIQQNISKHFQIRIVDSQNVSLGIGLLVIRAAELIRQGISFSKLANELEKLAEQIYSFFVVCDPSLLRGLREAIKISFLDTQAAKGLSLKPILKCNRGEISVYDRKRGYKAAIEEAIEAFITQMHFRNSYDKVGIVYSGSQSDMMNNEIIYNYRNYLASLGLGTIASVSSPVNGIYTGLKSVGFSIINNDIKIQDILHSPSQAKQFA